MLAGGFIGLFREARGRPSARQTAGRTAVGARARAFLRGVGIELFGFVRGGGPDPARLAACQSGARGRT